MIEKKVRDLFSRLPCETLPASDRTFLFRVVSRHLGRLVTP